MSCSVKIKSLDYLKAQGAIADKREVRDLDKFNEINDLLTELALVKYNVGGPGMSLFTSTSKYVTNFDGSTRHLVRAEANNKLFKLLQEATDVEEVVPLTKAKEVDLYSLLGEVDDIFLDQPLEREEDNLTNLSTLEDKLIHAISKMDQSLTLTIKGLNFQLKRSNLEGDKLEAFETQIEALKELQQTILTYQDTNKVLAIKSFSEAMIVNLKYVAAKLKQVDNTDEEYLMNAVKRYSQVVDAYSVIDELQALMSTLDNQKDETIASPTEVSEIKEVVKKAKSDFDDITSNLYDKLKDAMRFKLNDIKYHPEIEKNHYNRLVKEHKQSKIPENKDTWIIKTMNGRDRDKISEDVKKAVNTLIESPSWDIYAADVQFSSAINVSDRMIQIMNQMLLEIDNKRNTARIEKDKQFEILFNELIAEKGTSNIKDLYKNILQFDSNGKAYYKGDYKSTFYTDVHLKINSINNKYRDKINKVRFTLSDHPVNSIKYNSIKDEIIKLNTEATELINKIHIENFDKTKDGLRIKDKWLNDKSNMTEVEKKVLDFFIATSEEIQGMTHPTKSQNTIKYSYAGKEVDNVKFYELPKITKKDSERIWSGDGLGIIKDKFTDLKEYRPDDIGYTTKQTTLSGKEIKNLKLWYRDSKGTFSNNDQSLDLMTITRLDYLNASSYQIRGEAEQELNFLLTIAKNKDYNQKAGTLKIKSNISGKYNLVKGESTNVYKMMNNMLESRFYDQMTKGHMSINNKDMHKIVGFINSASSFLTLSLNIASGTANVVNASAQLFLESFFKGHFIKASGIKKANKIYGQNMIENMKDIQRPINRSFVNQVNEIFNIKGLFNLSNANFLKNDLLKAGLTTKSLQIFQDSGEHYIQSIASMAVLDGIKVMNGNSEFINTKGEVVTQKKAASLLDMMEVDKVDGIVKLSEKVVYTTHSRVSKWNEGGKEKVDMLIRKKLYDIVGNYTETDQAEIMRHWWGKLLMLYRKYLIPMGQARLRGIETSFKSKSKLTPDERRFSFALQEYDEGTYTTLIRYAMESIRQQKFFLLTKERIWNELSDYEKHNIRRAVIETVVANALLPLAAQLVVSLGAEDDDEYVFFVAYQLRRLETELSQYRSIGESFKMMRSPIPSARLLETALNTMKVWNWGEEYKSGNNKDKNKAFTNFKKQIPLLKEFQRTYRDLYEFQNSGVGTGISK